MVNKLVLENLRHRPIRTFLTVMAIGLQVTMILTLVGLSRGMLEGTASRTRGIGADVMVRPPGTSAISFSSAPMSEKIMKILQEQPHITLVTGTAVHPVGGVNIITGIDLDGFNRMSGGFEYLSGGPFAKPRDILVDEFYALQNRLKVGDSVRVMNIEWNVCGIVKPGKLARVFVPLKELQDLTANTGRISVAYAKVDDAKNIPQVVEQLKKRFPDNPVYSMEEFLSQFSVSNVDGLSQFITVIVGLSVAFGFLVVFLAMYTAVLERTREIGILKALGASPSYILNILLRETTLLAVFGCILGILFTYGTRWFIMARYPGTLAQVIVPDWWPIALGIALGGAVLGVLYPGLKAARQDAIEALAYE